MTKRTGRTGLIAVLGLFAGLGLAAAWRAPAHSPPWCLPSRCRPEPADAAVREAERAALVTLYTALDGPNWFSATSGAATGRSRSGTACRPTPTATWSS